MRSDRLAAVLIRCYPPALRREFGDEMRDFWQRRRLAASTWTARRRLWTSTTLDLVRAWAQSATSSFGRMVHPARSASGFWRDLQGAWKGVRRRPALSLAAASILAVGLGFSIAALSIVHALLFAPYPYPSLSRLVLVRDGRPAEGAHQGRSLPAGDAFAIAADAKAFSGVTLWRVQSAVLGDARGAAPETFEGLAVTPNFFAVLGVAADEGRTFARNDDGAARATGDELVISHRVWRSRFAGRADVIGTQVRVNDRPMTLVGVIADDACYPSGVDVWVSTTLSPGERADHTTARYRAIGRLKDDSSLGAAQAEANQIAQSLAARFPDTNRGRGFELSELRSEQFEFTAAPFLLVQVSACLVLALAVINVMGLLAVRASERAREFAMRSLLGASRAGLFVSQVIEAGLLVATATVFALALAGAATAGVRQLLPEGISRWFAGWSSIRLDATVVLGGVSIAAISAIVLGAALGWRAVRLARWTDVTTAGRSTVGVAGRSQRVMVIVQMALAMALVVCGAMIFGGFERLARGFDANDPTHTVVFRIVRPSTESAPALVDFHARLASRLTALPGVTDAGVVQNHPASNVPCPIVSVLVDGRPAPPPNDRFHADLQTVSPGALRAVGLQVLDGRALEDADRLSTQRVGVVSASMASTLWPDGRAVGARIQLGGPSAPWMTIVGVVTDLKLNWYDADRRPTVYVPFAQAPLSDLYVVVRTVGRAAAVAGAVRAAVHDVDPMQPVSLPRVLEDEVSDSITPIRALTILVGAAGLVAVMLAMAGIHAAIAQVVATRRREFGLRLALGATPQGVGWLILRRALTLASAGILAGAPCAWFAAAALRRLLFDVATPSALAFAASTAALLVVAAAAAGLPSLAARRTDPAILLRLE